MLGVKSYAKDYIEDCKANINEQLKTYNELIAGIKRPDSKTSENFEQVFFNNLIVLLDAFFVHRVRAIEGKDGNPLNEVRVLANSVLSNKNIMDTDNTIKLKPGNSLLKFEPGDRIKLNQQQFLLLSNAFFAEIEKKYL